MVKNFRLQIRINKMFYDRILFEAIKLDKSISTYARDVLDKYFNDLDRIRSKKIVEVRQ